MNPILSMLAKDVRLLVRDRMAFFFTFFFPLLMAIFFGTIFSGSGPGEGSSKIGILVVDEDGTAESQRFVKTLEAAEEFKVQRFEDAVTATNLVRTGKAGATAMVRLPKGFGEASSRLFYGDPATLELVTDPSRKAEAGMLQGLLTKYAFTRLQDLFTNPSEFRPNVKNALDEVAQSDGLDPATKSALQAFLPQLDTFLQDVPATAAEPAEPGDTAASPAAGGGWMPLKIEARTVQANKKGPSNAYAVSFPQGIMWGVIGCCLSLGLTIVTERTRGTLVRLRMSPLSRTRILAGKAITCFVMTVAVSAGLLLIARFVPFFHVVPTSIPLTALAIVCIGICFTGLMMLIAVVGKSEQSAAGLGWGVMLIFAMLGGGMVPQFIMQPWMQKAGSISPVKWAMQALDGAIWRGNSLAEMAVPCIILVVVGVVTFVIGVRLFKWSEG